MSQSPGVFGAPGAPGSPYPSPAGRDPQNRGLLRLSLSLVVIVLGIANFFVGFAPFAAEDKNSTGDSFFDSDSMSFFDNLGIGVGIVALSLLLLSALVVAVGMIPRQPANVGVAAAIAVTGFITTVFAWIGLAPGAKAGAGLIIVAILGFFQAAVAVALVMVDSNIVLGLGQGSGAMNPYPPGYAAPQQWPAPSPGFTQPQQSFRDQPGDAPPPQQWPAPSPGFDQPQQSFHDPS